jgi:hypothetical protein
MVLDEAMETKGVLIDRLERLVSVGWRHLSVMPQVRESPFHRISQHRQSLEAVTKQLGRAQGKVACDDLYVIAANPPAIQ